MHAAKWFFEVLTILFFLSGLFGLYETIRVNNAATGIDDGVQLFAYILDDVVMLGMAFVLLIIWWACAHFGRVSFWW